MHLKSGSLRSVFFERRTVQHREYTIMGRLPMPPRKAQAGRAASALAPCPLNYQLATNNSFPPPGPCWYKTKTQNPAVIDQAIIAACFCLHPSLRISRRVEARCFRQWKGVRSPAGEHAVNLSLRSIISLHYFAFELA